MDSLADVAAIWVVIKRYGEVMIGRHADLRDRTKITWHNLSGKV
jgi:hypothetical protein